MWFTVLENKGSLKLTPFSLCLCFIHRILFHIHSAFTLYSEQQNNHGVETHGAVHSGKPGRKPVTRVMSSVLGYCIVRNLLPPGRKQNTHTHEYTHTQGRSAQYLLVQKQYENLQRNRRSSVLKHNHWFIIKYQSNHPHWRRSLSF